MVSRRVKPGREQEFEEWVSGILAAANKFPAYLGSEVLRPSDPDERHNWLRKSRPILQEEEKFNVLTGLETWFTLPSKPGEPPPPRYKMAIVTWLGIFPVVTAICFPQRYCSGGERDRRARTDYTICCIPDSQVSRSSPRSCHAPLVGWRTKALKRTQTD